MEIKDFIKDALAQIVDGVQEANTALKGKDNPLLLSKFYLDAMDAVKEATDAVKEAIDAEKDANGIRDKRRRLEGKKRLR